MNTFKYIFRSIKFYKRQHFAILLGTILSTAIVTGALIVGDSVKYSLGHLVEKRLGKVEFAIQTNERFVSTSLSGKLGNELTTNSVGILKLGGIAINSDIDIRLNAVEILGIDSTFWQLASVLMPNLSDDEAYISENVASRLHLKTGDEILLRVKNADIIPLNTAFAMQEQSSVAIRFTIKAVLTENQFGRFSLKSDQKAPFNVWVSKSHLAKKMAIENKINTILISDTQKQFIQSNLEEVFKKVWTFDDAALTMQPLADSSQYEITSSRVFIDNTISDMMIQNHKAEGVLTYLVNSINFNSKSTPYSFVSGVSKNFTNCELSDNEIIINDWCATDLGISVGDSVNLEYFAIGPYRKLELRTYSFRVKSIEPNQGALFVQNLTPNFPGLSDAESCSEWDTGIPIQLDKIRDNDEDYWNKYKGTPKAIITLEKAALLWGNQYGKYTALRVDASGILPQNFQTQLMNNLNPTDLGFQFTNVKSAGKSAATKGVDFGELFMSLSFFVIAAGLLLLVLMYSLHIFSRKTEIGTLTSLGFSQTRIMGLFMKESVVTLIFGGIVGVGLGIIYNLLILKGLNTLWQDAVRTDVLEVFISPKTLVMGALIGISLALLVIFIVIRKQLRLQASQIHKVSTYKSNRIPLNQIIAFVSLLVGLTLVSISLLSQQSMDSGNFLAAGGLILVSLIAFAALWLKGLTQHFETKPFGLFKMALKNLVLKRTRSILAIALLALGTFTVIITGANRRTFYGASEQRQSGTGGFMFWGENSMPIIYDLNSPEGRAQLNFESEPIADSLKFIQLLALDGDDASCLNLNQVQQPRILGLNTQMFEQLNPFSFAQLIKGGNNQAPWTELNKTYGENIIPAYADQTVITWGLMKKIGDTLLYKDEFGADLKLLIAGGLNNSLFQGNILISDTQFRNHFPSLAGSKVMLIDSKTSNSGSIATFLDTYFKDYGITFTLATERLAEFNSVENTYLNVFMLLGGLGVAIGTIGFGIVLLRNKIERKSEFALLSAMGFTNNHLFRLIFVEHVVLLVMGLGIGIIAAFIGILPSYISPSFALSGIFVFKLLLIILLGGMLSIFISARVSRKSSIISALRNE